MEQEEELEKFELHKEELSNIEGNWGEMVKSTPTYYILNNDYIDNYIKYMVDILLSYIGEKIMNYAVIKFTEGEKKTEKEERNLRVVIHAFLDLTRKYFDERFNQYRFLSDIWTDMNIIYIRIYKKKMTGIEKYEPQEIPILIPTIYVRYLILIRLIEHMKRNAEYSPFKLKQYFLMAIKLVMKSLENSFWAKKKRTDPYIVEEPIYRIKDDIGFVMDENRCYFIDVQTKKRYCSHDHDAKEILQKFLSHSLIENNVCDKCTSKK